MVFSWFRSKKAAITSTSQQDEDASPPKIRKPQHAYRDARMSIPSAERGFYETIQARKRSSMMGLSFVSGSESGSGSGSGKGKERSPLDYDSGCTTTPASSSSSEEPDSHNRLLGSKTDLTGLWNAMAESERARHASSTATTSPAESSRDGAAREMKIEEA